MIMRCALIRMCHCFIQSWYTISGKGCFYIKKIKDSHISDEQDYNIVCQQYGLSLPQATCVFIEIQVVEPGTYTSVYICVYILQLFVCVHMIIRLVQYWMLIWQIFVAAICTVLILLNRFFSMHRLVVNIRINNHFKRYCCCFVNDHKFC